MELLAPEKYENIGLCALAACSSLDFVPNPELSRALRRSFPSPSISNNRIDQRRKV